MKYFLTEDERKRAGGSCYLEFVRGKFDLDDGCWRSSSLNISDDLFEGIELGKLFLQVVPSFDFYDSTEITKDDWEKLLALAHAHGGAWEEALTELTPWAEDNFRTEEVFSIFGL